VSRSVGIGTLAVSIQCMLDQPVPGRLWQDAADLPRATTPPLDSLREPCENEGPEIQRRLRRDSLGTPKLDQTRAK
jgi:hypothetical protein